MKRDNVTNVDFANKITLNARISVVRRLCNCGCASRGPAFHAGPPLKGDPTPIEKNSAVAEYFFNR